MALAERTNAALPACAARSKPARAHDDECIVLAPKHTVPPQPDATLLPETLRLQHRAGHTVTIRPGMAIDRGTVLREHCAAGREEAAAADELSAEEQESAFECYRRRLLWQMVKRRWFGALTDFNTERLFTDCDPAFFVRFVGRATAAIESALAACGDASDPHSVAGLHASGAIRLMLKGGNNVNMIKYRALCCLPPAVAAVLPTLAPSGLSDIDFLLMIDYVAAPWLDEPGNFAAVHDECRAAVDRALTALAVETERAVRGGDPSVSNFAALLRARDPAALSEELRARLNAATSALAAEIDGAVSGSVSPSEASVFDGVREMLRQLQLPAEAEVLPCKRRSLAISKDEAGGGVLRPHGDSLQLFVSNNEGVEHRDARCVLPEETCSFALVRAMIGYRVRSPGLATALAAVADDATAEDATCPGPGQAGRSPDSRLLKGEGVDVSLPTRRDVNLQLWCAGEADEQGTFVKEARLSGGGESVPLLVESVDALILEQRDLTFGKRAQTLAIWRASKVHKRLRRLVELCGVKLLTLPQFSWEEKRTAFGYLVRVLEDYAAHRFKPPEAPAAKAVARTRSEGSGPSAKPAAPAGKRRRHSSRAADEAGSAAAVAPTGSKRRRKSDSATRATRDTQPGDAVARAVCDAALLTDALIMPLRHSALKVFDLGPTTSLPADFASKWAETLRPLQDLAACFERALGRMARLEEAGRCPAFVPPEELYSYELGDAWWSPPQAAAAGAADAQVAETPSALLPSRKPKPKRRSVRWALSGADAPPASPAAPAPAPALTSAPAAEMEEETTEEEAATAVHEPSPRRTRSGRRF